MSPVWNKRTDEYGSSAENRMRFATEIVQLARMEKNRNNRLMLKLSICMVAFLIILIMGVSSMINDMNIKDK